MPLISKDFVARGLLHRVLVGSALVGWPGVAIVAPLVLGLVGGCGDRARSGANLAAAPPPSAATAAQGARATAPSASPAVAPSAEAAPAAEAASPTAAAAPTSEAVAGAAKASEHSAEEALDVGRVRQQPRKKTGKLKVDLDGDGKVETLTVDQTPAADDWRGETDKGPSFVARILAPDGSVAHEARFAGIATGWMRLPLLLGDGRNAVFLVWSKPDVSTPRAHVARWLDGKATLEPTAHLPLFHWDWQGNGVEAVVGISEELWQDFLRTGTTSVMDLSSATPRNLLPFVAFEVCLADPEQAKGQGGLEVFAIERTGTKLHALRPGADGVYHTIGSIGVSKPDDGSRWSVPSGFALACLGGYRVQYKGGVYRFADGRFRVEGSPTRPR